MIYIKDVKQQQTTIKKLVSYTGPSAYSKDSATVTLHPAKQNTGIQFKIQDIYIPANINYLDSSSYCHTTTISKGAISIKTVEHIISAVRGLQIDNITIELPQGEIPFLSCSAQEYVALLLKAGVVSIAGTFRRIAMFNDRVLINDPRSDGFIEFTPAETLTYNFIMDFPCLLGKQELFIQLSPKNYINEIAYARSFIRSPVKSIPDGLRIIRKFFPYMAKNNDVCSPVIMFNKERYLTPLYNELEPVRHKMLDFTGDIALLGYPLQAAIKAYKPGHALNHHTTKELLAMTLNK